MADTYRTYIAAVHENESFPYRKRIVQIELTPEQLEQLKPRVTGWDSGSEMHEEILDCWFEKEKETKE